MVVLKKGIGLPVIKEVLKNESSCIWMYALRKKNGPNKPNCTDSTPSQTL